MEVQDRRDSPPLWLQLPVSATMLRQPPPASLIFENSITSVILVPLLLLLVISFILSFVSNTSQIFRNNIVKNGWDLLNVVLVLFAILCGVVGKLYDDETQAVTLEVAIQTGTVSDQMTVNKESTSIFAIFDEFDLTINNNPPTSQVVHTGLNEVESDDCNIKIIPGDTCVLRPAQSSAKAPLPPSNPAKLRPRRNSPKNVLPPEKQHDEFVNIISPTLLRPPPLVTSAHQPQTAKKSGAGKGIATAIVSLYKHTKRKTKITTNKNQKNSLSPPSKPAIPHPSVLHNIFRKATKTKRIHAEASASPPSPSSSLGVKSKLLDSKKVQSNYLNDGKKTMDVGSNQSAEGNQLGGSVLCPSPDVNIKADKFIARLRGEWNLDNMDS